MAATKAKVIHHDISNKNIMFMRKADGTVQGCSLDLTLAR